MSSRLYGYNTIVSDLPKISGKLSACTNSGYQALSFPSHQEPGYVAKLTQTADKRRERVTPAETDKQKQERLEERDSQADTLLRLLNGTDEGPSV